MNPNGKPFPSFGHRSKKSLGQNFLVDENLLQKIVSLAKVGPDDQVLEIGPGLGNLTKYLVKNARKVFAVELDSALAHQLKYKIWAQNLDVIEVDILEFNFNEIGVLDKKLKVISNLPYNISTQVIFKVLESPGFFSELYLMLQKEVAERVVAKPHSRDYGILSVIAQLHSEPEIILRIGPQAFRPRPKVDSALVKFKVLEQPRFAVSDYAHFKKVVKACFRQRRKMIINSLTGSSLALEKDKLEELLERAGISPRSRAEEIELERLVKLANIYHQEKEQHAGTA